MSLLEALVAIVILGLSAAGLLGSFQQSARAVHDAELWLRASQVAEAAMEARKAGLEAAPDENGFTTQISERPLPGGLADVQVVVRLPRGQELVVHRVLAP